MSRDEWVPPEPTSNLNPDQFKDEPFDLSPEQTAYYDALDAADAHRERMAGMSVAERNQYNRGLREGLTGPIPKRGDFNNPLNKDMPKEPAPPKEPKAPKPVDPMVRIRKIQRLGKIARGKKPRRR